MSSVVQFFACITAVNYYYVFSKKKQTLLSCFVSNLYLNSRLIFFPFFESVEVVIVD